MEAVKRMTMTTPQFPIRI